MGENEPNHTAQAQLLRIIEDDTKNPTLDEIEEAFSVEKVTKEFFTLYKDKYLDLKEHLETNEAFIEETENLDLKCINSPNNLPKIDGATGFSLFPAKERLAWCPDNAAGSFISGGEFKDIYISQDQAHQAILQKVFKSDDGI